MGVLSFYCVFFIYSIHWPVVKEEKNDEVTTTTTAMIRRGRRRVTETHEIKVAIIGAKDVGKTTIARMFQDFSGKFQICNCDDCPGETPSLSYAMTDEADLVTKDVPMEHVYLAADIQRVEDSLEGLRGDTVRITLWDTAGFDRYGQFPPSNVLRGCHILVVCFSCLSYDSMGKAAQLVKYAANGGLVSSGCVCIALGTKIDLLTNIHAQPRAAYANFVEDGGMYKNATEKWFLDAYDIYYDSEARGSSWSSKQQQQQQQQQQQHLKGKGKTTTTTSLLEPKLQQRLTTRKSSLSCISKSDIQIALSKISDSDHLLHETWWVLSDGMTSRSATAPPAKSALLGLAGGNNNNNNNNNDDEGEDGDGDWYQPGDGFEFSTSPHRRPVLMSFTTCTKAREGSFANPIYCIYHAVGLHLSRKVFYRKMASSLSPLDTYEHPHLNGYHRVGAGSGETVPLLPEPPPWRYRGADVNVNSSSSSLVERDYDNNNKQCCMSFG